MIAVIFELEPADGQFDRYLDMAKELRPLLEKVDGFISVERFQSLGDPNRFMSLSFWRDEAAVHQWRTLEQHRKVQSEGRFSVFDDYRLRVAKVQRDYGMWRRGEAPEDSKIRHRAKERDIS
ncbi:antibiotic biosynthesis monooxygenase family protein [Flexibacterium corallicola]|uniref:antibiotic biosynthesis monooxygenase family protein n=1 Tax=Flexibacterium corallicola TaxID=3037259 RepID=UPI00286F675C|nr:antibiotic biosynthesis monooxygenase [Pseudovibrio sp. M1P-2-3]